MIDAIAPTPVALGMPMQMLARMVSRSAIPNCAFTFSLENFLILEKSIMSSKKINYSSLLYKLAKNSLECF